MKRWISAVLVVALSGHAQGPCAASAYKCKAADGSVTFQDRPCANQSTQVDRVDYAREPDAPHTQYVPSRDNGRLTEGESGVDVQAPRERARPRYQGDRGIGSPPLYPDQLVRCETAHGKVYLVPEGHDCGTTLVADPARRENRTPTGPVYDSAGRPLDAHWINEREAVDNRTGRVLYPHEIQRPPSASVPKTPVRDQGRTVDRDAVCAELRERYRHLPVNTTKRARDALDKQIADNCVKKSLWQ